ncbi:unnamed protein product [Chrysodeixis includens]|uniref:Uncharacterized protein n=1 Tax=Chrysodeixis includens TaxID=689277 RepID=A0A9N8Q329_CHRIL|nr:unnamed protein product [Chrysodeixis includens]
MAERIYLILVLNCSWRSREGSKGQKKSNNCWANPKNSPFLFHIINLKIKKNTKSYFNIKERACDIMNSHNLYETVTSRLVSHPYSHTYEYTKFIHMNFIIIL